MTPADMRRRQPDTAGGLLDVVGGGAILLPLNRS